MTPRTLPRPPARTWPLLVVLALLAAAVVWLAPQEHTLGQGIKVVYVHVALTWAGQAGLLVAGLLGLVLAVRPRAGLQAWVHALGWVALGTLAAGTAVSLWAEQVNWGGIDMSEPRTLAALQLLAVGLIVQVLYGWLELPRLRGLLALALAAFLVWNTAEAPLVLHPRDAVFTSTSLAIQGTFYGLFVLCAAAEALVTRWLKRMTG